MSYSPSDALAQILKALSMVLVAETSTLANRRPPSHRDSEEESTGSADRLWSSLATLQFLRSWQRRRGAYSEF